MPAPRDPRPGARLVESYPLALAVARRKYPFLSPSDREDLVQEAFAKVLARLRHGPLADPASYLLRVVFTTGARMLQDRHRSTVPLEPGRDGRWRPDDLELRLDRSLAPLTPEEHVVARDEAAAIWRVLADDLSADERLVLVRRALEGRSPADVAGELEITERRYRRLLETAGRKLAAAFDRDG